MVKGINRQVLEIHDTGCAYFERAFFFVNPEYAKTDEKKLRAAAEQTLGHTDTLPRTKRIRHTPWWAWVLTSFGAAGFGASMMALLFYSL